MSAGIDDTARPPPAWLIKLTVASALLAGLALAALLWAKWAVVLAMSQDILKYCF